MYSHFRIELYINRQTLIYWKFYFSVEQFYLQKKKKKKKNNNNKKRTKNSGLITKIQLKYTIINYLIILLLKFLIKYIIIIIIIITIITIITIIIIIIINYTLLIINYYQW